MKNNEIKRSVLFGRNSAIIIFCILMVILLSIINPKAFYSSINLRGILNAFTINLTPALGMTVLLISGGFDLSIGANLSLTTVIIGILLKGSNTPIFLAIIIGLLCATAFGLVNGVIVGKIGVNPFITTLATMYIISSLALVVSGGDTISGFPKQFTNLARYQLLTIPLAVYIVLIIFIIFYILLKKNRFFRHTFLVGDNERAARLVGIKTVKLKIILYVVMGFIAGLAGLIYITRFNYANPVGVESLGFTAATAAIIGGASIRGGKGSIIGTFFGVLLIRLIDDAMVLLKINTVWTSFVTGILLFMVVIYDEYNLSRSK